MGHNGQLFMQYINFSSSSFASMAASLLLLSCYVLKAFPIFLKARHFQMENRSSAQSLF